MNIERRESVLRIEQDEVVFEGRFSTTTQRHFTNTRDGKHGVWEVFSRKGATGRVVGVLGVTSAFDAVLVNIYRVPLRAWVVSLVYGGCMSGESETQTAQREFQEETGYVINEPRLLFAGPFAPGVMADEMSVFVGFGATPSGAASCDVAEDIDILVLPLRDATKELASLSLSGKALVDVKVFGALYATKEICGL
ncbi:MAG: ADP-ribose pyrophosphatase [Parcubacteria group bacterium Gr01-1014_17]|nr:MAG: ADP-ribose pyrophosphatase [Parcubacteria group bacterium Gr01-1014_17]